MDAPASPAPPAKGPQPVEIALLASVFVVAACGLVYELTAAALSSYLLGDSVLQFSTIIGTYLFAMGVGSWLSRYFERQLPAHFLRIELLVALIGVLIFWLCFLIIDKLTPYDLWNEIVEKQNVALGLVVAAMSLGISIIVAAAIH